MPLADANGDGVVNFGDLDAFVAAVTGSISYQAWTYTYDAENRLVAAFPGIGRHTVARPTPAPPR